MLSCVTLVVEPKFVCLTHNEAKQTKHHGVWSREKFTARAKQGEQATHAQKALKLHWFSEKSFYRQNLEGELQGM